jgi:ketosteroid isomerase-like protein
MSLHADAEETLSRWHRMVAARDLSDVSNLCAPSAVFRSPVAFTPYRGPELGATFLQQAVQVFRRSLASAPSSAARTASRSSSALRWATSS